MTPAPPEPTPERDSADLFDYQAIKLYTLFVLGAPRRRPLLSAALFGVVVVFAVLAVVLLPRTYRVQTVILAQPNQVLPSLGNPRRSIPGNADAPTRAASETVLQYNNLVSLVRQTDLVAGWAATRSPLHRVKDTLMRVIRGAPSEEDMREALVGFLEKRLNVETQNGIVTISIDWPDAQLAYRLVQTAQHNFLERRHALEVAAIEEAIAILEERASVQTEEINAALEGARVARVETENEKRGLAPDGAAKPRPAVASSSSDRAMTQLRSLIAAKRRAITDLEQFRQRRMAELQAQLAEQRTSYGPAHPVVLNTQEALTAMAKPTPQLEELKAEERELIAEYQEKGGRDVESSQRPSRIVTGPPIEAGGLHIELAPVTSENEKIEYASARLRMVLAKQEELADRIEAAKIELETSRAAFKYRYTEIKPPQLPKKPIAPNPQLILMGGLFAAVLAAVFGAVAMDVWTGRILARWQIERTLGLPVLAEVGGR